MNDLPDPPSASQGNSQIITNPPAGGPIIQSSHDDIPQTATSGSINKEIEVASITSGEALPLKDIGTKEFELPKEVASVGVKTQPTTVQIPPKVTDFGVKPAGASVPVGTGQSVTLPLTDAQIAEGLKQSITSSWRWLSVWCERKIKQMFRVQNRKQSKH